MEEAAAFEAEKRHLQAEEWGCDVDREEERREFAQGKLDVARLAVNRHITGKEQQMHRGTGPRQFAGLVDMSLVQRTRL